jgi:hypothetical protein
MVSIVGCPLERLGKEGGRLLSGREIQSSSEDEAWALKAIVCAFE